MLFTPWSQILLIHFKDCMLVGITSGMLLLPPESILAYYPFDNTAATTAVP